MANTATAQQENAADQQAIAKKAEADKQAAAAKKAEQDKANREKAAQHKTEADKAAQARGTTAAQEKAEQEKVDREREIMRDPHEKAAGKIAAGGPMPSYRDKDGHTVSALQIAEVKEVDHGDTELHFVNQNYGPVRVKAPWITVNLPRPTGWFVADKTGTYYMNAQNFAARYTRGV